MGNRNVLSACSLFEKLPKYERADFEKFTADVEMLTEKERFHIFDLLDKIMISLNKISWESITLPIFKYWCDLSIFENLFFGKFMGDILADNPSKDLENKLNSVDPKVRRFFLRGLLHFKKMNIKIVDTDINAQKSESSLLKDNWLMLYIKRIKNCETIQDLIDDSPTDECPICKNVTFTESTSFLIRVSCNHLVCCICAEEAFKYSRLVKKCISFLSFN